MTPTLSSCRWLRLLVTVATLGPLAAQAELSVPIGYAGDPTASASLGAQQQLRFRAQPRSRRIADQRGGDSSPRPLLTATRH